MAIHADQGVKGEQVVSLMEHLAAWPGAPGRIQADNRGRFISKALDKWPRDHCIMDFYRSGKPTDNFFIESFNGSSRD